MKQNNIISSIKTIAESLIAKAGFDKTRTGNIVGRNEITNTYSVKIDGNVYNNVRVVNDCTYNVGDTVKVSIPCNQASQMYIMSSVFSDESIGKKIGELKKIQQYYLEGSHQAIIQPELFDLVQIEFEKRKGQKRSTAGIFASKLICGDCGHFYGNKVWHSNSKYRRTVWQCNSKFRNNEKCKQIQ